MNSQSTQTKLTTLDKVKIGCMFWYAHDVDQHIYVRDGVMPSTDIEVFAHLDALIAEDDPLTPEAVAAIHKHFEPPCAQPQYKTLEETTAGDVLQMSGAALDNIGASLNMRRYDRHLKGLEPDQDYRPRLLKALTAFAYLASHDATVPATDKIRPNYYRVACTAERDDGNRDEFEIECQDVIDALELNFNLGNTLKCLWRAGRKTPDALTDLKKARQYLDFEIQKKESGK